MNNTIKCPICKKPTKKEWQLKVGADNKTKGKLAWVCEDCYLEAEHQNENRPKE